jgi:hypothetical protein
MTRALIYDAAGQVVQIDLAEATPEEAAIAIRDNNELALVQSLVRAANEAKEPHHELE